MNTLKSYTNMSILPRASYRPSRKYNSKPKTNQIKVIENFCTVSLKGNPKM